jgi:predicted RNA methylase
MCNPSMQGQCLLGQPLNGLSALELGAGCGFLSVTMALAGCKVLATDLQVGTITLVGNCSAFMHTSTPFDCVPSTHLRGMYVVMPVLL